MSAFDILAFLVALPPTLLLAIFIAEVGAGLRPLPSRSNAGSSPHTVVLIPAHDEATGIAATVTALRQADPLIDLLVVADNCTDATAGRARSAGARVVERTDPSRRGKGYALAFGRRALAASPPDCVVVLDADCIVEEQGIAALAQVAIAENRPVQARYLQRPNHEASATAQISNFAFLVKNLVRQRGMERLGGVVALTGTGMAFPWRQFADAPLASAELAEDLALGTWLTLSGHAPILNEDVHVWSKAEAGEALLVQRHRWERGFLSIARRQALPLIGRGLLTGSRSRTWLGLHLLVPPLALLFVIAGAALIVDGLLALVGTALSAVTILGAMMLVAGIATIAAWITEGRGRISGRALLAAPFYVMTKLPLYRGLLRNRGQAAWVRTQRAGEATRDDEP